MPVFSPPLKRAVLLSVLAHGLLLFTYRLPELTNIAPSGLVATLGQATSLPANQAEVKSASEPSLHARDTASHVQPDISKQTVISSPTGAPAPMAAMSPQPQASASPSAAATNSVYQQSASPSPSGSAPADALRDYRLQLARQARRLKSYPPLARQRGQEGTVELVLSHPLAGSTVLVQLQRRSGVEALDNQALQMMEKVVRQVELPSSLNDKVFQMSLSIEYRLEDE